MTNRWIKILDVTFSECLEYHGYSCPICYFQQNNKIQQIIDEINAVSFSSLNYLNSCQTEKK